MDGDSVLPEELGIPGLEDLRPIGAGGFATVYRARQPQFARDVAVKVIQTDDLDETAKARFERECQALGKLSSHPGIVTVYHAGFTARGRPYLVMEYFPEGSLADRLEETGPLAWESVAAIGAHLAAALAAAHRHDIVHRDIKPANVFVSSDGHVAVGDFGIARIAGAAETRSGVITASLAHAPPEVLDNQRPTAKSDIYSLGSTLFELVAGTPAFVDEHDEVIASLLSRIALSPVPDLRLGGVPSGLAEVLERAMAKDPGHRWEDAEAMAEALRSLASGDGNETVYLRRLPSPTPHRPAPVGESRRVVWRVVAGLVILGMVVTAALFITADGDPSEQSISTNDRNVATTGTTVTESTVTTLPRTTSTVQSLDPNAVESYYTTDGTRPALAPTCLGLLSLCLRQPVDSAAAELGTEDERTDFGGGDVFHSWNLTPEVRLSVISDSVGSIKSLTVTRSTIVESGFRTFAPEGGLFGDITMAGVLGQYGVTPNEETLPGEGFILYTYSYVRGSEGSAVLEFTHGAPFDDDPGGFNSDLDGRLVTSVTVREA